MNSPDISCFILYLHKIYIKIQENKLQYYITILLEDKINMITLTISVTDKKNQMHFQNVEKTKIENIILFS